MNKQEWFDYQISRIENVGLGEAGEILKAQQDIVLEKAQNLEWHASKIPFFAVVPHPFLRKIGWYMLNGHPAGGVMALGGIICRKNDMRGCGTVNLADSEIAEEIQQEEPYWIYNIDTGAQNIGKPQDEVLVSLKEEGRRLLTLSETAFLTFSAAHTPFEGVPGIEVPFDLGTSTTKAEWVGVKPISCGGEVRSFSGIQPSARLGIFRSGRLHPNLAGYFSNEGGGTKGTPSCTC